MKRVALFAGLAVALLISGGIQPVHAQDVVWKFAHENQETVPAAKAAHMVADLVSKATGGKFQIQIYPAGQLGKEQELVQQVQTGSVQMAFTPTAPLSNFDPRMQLVDLPFLFPSRQAVYAVLDGETGKDLLGTLEQRGIHGLGFWESGFKQMTSSTKPILSPADLRGQKIRTMQSPMLLQQYRSWGANPMAISFSETYNALQQGVADGQENPLISINSMKLYEVQKYLTLSNHGYTAFVVFANKQSYDALTPAYREALDGAVKQARDWERVESEKVDQELLKMISQHMKVYQLTDEGRREFTKLSREMHRSYEGKVTKAALDAVYAQTKPYEK